MEKRVLILCHDFPPHTSVAAQRPYSWYQYFKKYGYTPTIITKSWQVGGMNPIEVLRKEYAGKNSVTENELGKIISVTSNKILPEKMLLNYGEDGWSFVRRIFTFIYRFFSFIIPFFDRNHTIYKAAVAELKKQKYDFVLCTGEPFILFLYGHKLRKKFGVRWIADYRDMWKNNHNARFRNDVLSRILKWWEWQFEKRIVKTACFVTTTEPHNQETLKYRLSKKVVIVYNGFDEFYTPQSKPAKSNKLILTHTGTILQGQQPEFLIEAISQLHLEKKISPADIELRFVGIKFYRDQIQRLLSINNQLESYMVFTDRISASEALALNAESDYLISLVDPEYKTISVKTNASTTMNTSGCKPLFICIT